MFLVLLTTATEPELLLTSMAPLIYSIMGLLGFIVLGKGLYNGEGAKTIIGKILLIAVICYMAYKPIVMRNLGETIVNFVTAFTQYF